MLPTLGCVYNFICIVNHTLQGELEMKIYFLHLIRIRVWGFLIKIEEAKVHAVCLIM